MVANELGCESSGSLDGPNLSVPLLSKADRLPPFVCRLIAREKNGRKPLSYSAIAKETGLSRSRVAEILVATSWKRIPVEDADKIAGACGVDLSTPGRYYKWMKKAALMHIHTGTAAQKKMFARLMAMAKER